MNSFLSVPKNGSLAKINANANYPTWSSLVDELFNGDLSSATFNSGNLPKVNIKETAESYEIELAAPGLKKSDFKLDVDNGVLSISAQRSEENEVTQSNYTRKEYSCESFQRTFKLPESINDEHINAQYTDGILQITLPKKEEAKQKPVRSIDIL